MLYGTSSAVLDDTAAPGCLCFRSRHVTVVLPYEVGFTELTPSVLQCFISDEILSHLKNAGVSLSLFSEKKPFYLAVFSSMSTTPTPGDSSAQRRIAGTSM